MNSRYFPILWNGGFFLFSIGFALYDFHVHAYGFAAFMAAVGCVQLYHLIKAIRFLNS